MPTPYYSGKYHFQVELKALCLPVTITIPDIPDATPGCDGPSGSLTVPLPTEARCVASDSTSHRLSIATQRREDAQGLGTTTDSPDISISIDDQLDLLSGLGISVRIKSIRRTQLKFRWFHMKGTIAPLDNPSDIPGLDRVDFRPFDIPRRRYGFGSHFNLPGYLRPVLGSLLPSVTCVRVQDFFKGGT
ncbi:hypothetical protein EDB92DRAFT_1819759 [Lactarius akahatsu]|uniref:Uncharacterized protein n=1 Tax=Lactarius akahatsu TaxID=416441 RepID=A0AAD4L795_9AGAM|nr:hypothetical protein EDB92DRAFT_1822301 [Lactarius akahatsu]KAH8982855.1 hypothetical protein EDB92DRAFT_1819759 [Lactarius akahatsu]